ncbi:hypothetical protein EFA69_14520 [Rufibacter immobilis]|uniref:Uncharacterized protein n=1 Tax=Rufibacter immobilis TaxID=1348778 RepID=A0A3M9MR49_9BACT|nr:hypothetical protein EFA69_14520 [Rufibacter immobilis]
MAQRLLNPKRSKIVDIGVERQEGPNSQTKKFTSDINKVTQILRGYPYFPCWNRIRHPWINVWGVYGGGAPTGWRGG